MKIARVNDNTNDLECWLTSNRKVMLKNGEMIVACDTVIGQELWDEVGAYLGIVVEIVDYKSEKDGSI
jgi:hypothetical protein